MNSSSFLKTLACALLASTLLLSGCGGGPSVAPVSGVVTLDGAPLSGASVNYQPESVDGATDGSYGQTDATGKYVLKLVSNDAEGAVPGKHRVMISMVKPTTDDTPSLGPGLPTRYNTASELSFQVPAEGSEAANFDLESK